MSSSPPPPPKPSKTAALKQKLTAKYHKLRKTPLVTPEQKLHLKLDTMNTEAINLNNTVSHLLSQAATFSSRSANTPFPSDSPPAERAPLFERHEKGPPSNYDAQVRAYDLLIEEWEVFKGEVRGWEKRLEIFGKTLENLKGRYYDIDKAVGKSEHGFIGLGNAEYQLKLKRGELEEAVMSVNNGMRGLAKREG